MHDLIAITPLGATSARADTIGGISIIECPDWALASVTCRLGQQEEMQLLAKKFLGCALPPASMSASKDVFTALWIGPDQWMVEAPHHSHEDLAAQLKARLGETASVTEQSDGWCRFDLKGAICHDVLERLCNVNTRAMVSGAVSRTRLEHLGCFVVSRETDKHFSVIGPRSSARSIHHAIIVAAKSAA